ncbi:MAG: DUF5050 domain-containing protein, partial [Oscillospiraceae bacterium]|nr:DUF5050 domain-containing protein [Oscillospiraceae bacterium]
ALEISQKFNIAHKNIKPENIFVSKLGDFMLGDFGISRTAEKIASGLPKKGAYAYVAPELYLGDPCGTNVDTYSLGIVLYRMLNDNRIPFLPEYPAQISGSAYREAVVKRVRGAPLPKPKNAPGRLAEIILKACAYAPGERYNSPKQMKEDLGSILYTAEEAVIAYPRGDLIQPKPIEYIEEDDIPFSETIVWEAAPFEPEKAEHKSESIGEFDIRLPEPPLPAPNSKKRGRKPWKPLALLCAAAVLLAGGVYAAISTAPKKDPGEPERSTAFYTGGAAYTVSGGNTPGNIANGGYAAIEGDRIYYSNGNDNWTLHTKKTDGSGAAKLCDDRSYGINASGGFIYYINATDDKKIYSIKTDGSSKKKLCDDESSGVNIDGDTLYYINESDNGAIYSMKTDGSGKKKLCGDKSSGISIDGDTLYYVNESDNGAIYSMKTDGSAQKKLNGDWYARYMNVAGGKIYYSNTGDNKRLYVMNTDGSGRRSLGEGDGVHNINVAGEQIYYSNISDGGRIYLMGLDGRGKYKLNDDDSQNINIAGDTIYYINIGDNYKMYSIKTDGSGRKALE